jgi:fatty-acid peroxygenase
MGWQPLQLSPQGGGDYDVNNRCSGKWITITLMKVALSFLVSGMKYEVPMQDLRIDYSRVPAPPRSGLVIDNVTTNNDSHKLTPEI